MPISRVTSITNDEESENEVSVMMNMKLIVLIPILFSEWPNGWLGKFQYYTTKTADC